MADVTLHQGAPAGGTPDYKEAHVKGGKNADQLQALQGAANSNDTVADLDDFSKVIYEVLQDNAEELKRALGTGEDPKETEEKQKLQQGEAATTAEGAQQEKAQDSRLNRASVENTLGATASEPALRPPPPDAKIPLGKDGIGNPWLKPSLAAALFTAWFEILPALMQIKIEEAKAEGKELVRGAELSLAKAGAIKESHNLAAKQMMVEAISLFVQAGIQVAQLFTQVAMQAVSMAWNAVAGVANMAMQTVSSVVNTGMSVAGSALGAATGGKMNFGGMQMGNMQIPNMSPDQVKQMTDMMNGAWSAASTVTKALSEAIKSSIEILKGNQEYMKSIWEHMLQTSYNMQKAHGDSKKEASEVIGSFLQAILQFIQFEQAFRHNPG